MTTKEYLNTTLSRFQLNESDIDLIMTNQNLTDGVVDVLAAKTAIYNEFSNMIPLMDLSEGTMSIKWNMPAIRMWYSLLAKELGKEDVLQTISQSESNDEVNDRSYLF